MSSADPRWNVPGPPGAARQTSSNTPSPNTDRSVRADETRAGSGRAGFSWDSTPYLSEEDQLIVGGQEDGRAIAGRPCLFEPTQLRASADGNAAFVWKDIDSATYCCDMTNGQTHSSVTGIGTHVGV